MHQTPFILGHKESFDQGSKWVFTLFNRTCSTDRRTLLERSDTRPPQRAQNLVWQYEQRWPQPSANLVLWQIPQVGASTFCSGVVWVSSAIFFTWSLYDSNCWCNFLQHVGEKGEERYVSTVRTKHANTLFHYLKMVEYLLKNRYINAH